MITGTGSEKIPMTTRSEIKKTDFSMKKMTWLQAEACAWTRVVSGAPFEKEFKVQIAM